LAENESAVDILGNDTLKVIAHELVKWLKANISIDWAHRDSARARLRVLVKRILRKYGCPPDFEDAAARGILAEAEATLAEAIH
jgi:type I restriction enzyme R subunit